MSRNFEGMTIPDLEAKLIDNKKKCMDIRYAMKSGTKAVKTHILRKLRRDNARIKTVLRKSLEVINES